MEDGCSSERPVRFIRIYSQRKLSAVVPFWEFGGRQVQNLERSDCVLLAFLDMPRCADWRCLIDLSMRRLLWYVTSHAGRPHHLDANPPNSVNAWWFCHEETFPKAQETQAGSTSEVCPLCMPPFVILVNLATKWSHLQKLQINPPIGFVSYKVTHIIKDQHRCTGEPDLCFLAVCNVSVIWEIQKNYI